MEKLKKDAKGSFVIEDFFLFKSVKVVDEEGKIMARRLCLNCEVYGNLVIADNFMLLKDGRCLKIKQKCGNTGLFVVIEHLEFSGDGEEVIGNISYFRVFDFEAKEVFILKNCSTLFSSMETTLFHVDLTFEGDYFEFESEDGYGALALDGRVIVPAKYVYLYLEKDTDSGEPLFYCFKDEENDDKYDLYTLSGDCVAD